MTWISLIMIGIVIINVPLIKLEFICGGFKFIPAGDERKTLSDKSRKHRTSCHQVIKRPTNHLDLFKNELYNVRFP